MPGEPGNTLLGGHITWGGATAVFRLVASAVFFFMVKPVNALIARSRNEPPADPTTQKCPQCLSEIPIEAARCAFCAQPVAAA